MRILFIVFFTIFFFNAYSQTTFGISSGINLSQAVYLEQADEQLIKPIRKLKPGLFAGVYMLNNVNELISVQADLIYSQKGLKSEHQPYNISINTMDYIEIPIMGQYTVSNAMHSEFKVFVGAYFAYWIFGKYKRTELSTGITDVQKVDFKNSDFSYNRIDAGVLGGLTYRVKRTSFFGKYTFSMLGSSKENVDALSNRVISFGINYSIFE